MARRQSPDRYYDTLLERDQQRSWWRIALRYLATVITFIAIMLLVLSMYWVWEDYSADGYRGLTWESFSERAEFRWNEFLQGRIGLEQCDNIC
jgi:hypothetical protein